MQEIVISLVVLWRANQSKVATQISTSAISQLCLKEPLRKGKSRKQFWKRLLNFDGFSASKHVTCFATKTKIYRDKWRGHPSRFPNACTVSVPWPNRV